MSRIFVICSLICSFFLGSVVFAMSSTNFYIDWDNLNEGGDDVSTSTNYGIRDTLGDLATGTSTSATYGLSAGYRAGDGGDVLTFVIRAEDNGFVPVIYTAFDSGAKTVTASSVLTFSVGDYIAVSEDIGYGEQIAVGKITDITGLVITVDSWNGDNATMSASPSGANDKIFRLPGTVLNFGSVAQGTENVERLISSVFSTVDNGYTVYVHGVSLLQNPLAQIITPVSDGAVTLGQEEYGAEVIGSTAFGAGSDGAVTTTLRAIQSRSNPSVTLPDRVAMIYKISINASTFPGTYNQAVVYTLTPNY